MLVRARLERYGAALALAAIVVAGGTLRFATLGAQSLDHDEAFTAVHVIHPSLASTLAAVVRSERSPPLYYVASWAWTRAFGTGVIGLRSLSAALGTLTIAAAYLAGRELASRRAGLVAAALVAFNPYLIWFSQEARSYGLMIALVALALGLFARALREPTPAVLAGWALASALALCSHYFAAFAFVPEAALLAWRVPRGRSRAVAAGAAAGFVGAALVPLAVIQEHGGRSNEFTAVPLASRAFATLVRFATVEGPHPFSGMGDTIPAQRALAAATVAVLALGAWAGLRRGARAERRGAALAGAVGAGAFGLPLLLAAGGLDYVDSRNLAVALVPLLVAAAIGLGALRLPAARIAAAGASLALFVGAFALAETTPALERTDWAALAAAVERVPRGAEILVPRHSGTPIDYYDHAGLAALGATEAPRGHPARVVSVGMAAHRVAALLGYRLASVRTLPGDVTLDTFVAAHRHGSPARRSPPHVHLVSSGRGRANARPGRSPGQRGTAKRPAIPTA